MLLKLLSGMKVSKSNLTPLSTMMIAAVLQPRILIQSGFANSPIFFFSPVKRISGQTAKPSCIDKTTWLATRSWVVSNSPPVLVLYSFSLGLARRLYRIRLLLAASTAGIAV